MFQTFREMFVALGHPLLTLSQEDQPVLYRLSLSLLADIIWATSSCAFIWTT